ncbi:MAG: WS/DGAT/MGAT family O-acyltransferase [Micromonosporaceae bacterium]
MSGLDAGIFFAENDRTPLQIASVAVFEGKPPSYGDLARLILSKLPQVPRYRQRVRTVPLNFARPVWADDRHFQVHYHVRRVAVAAPGGASQLQDVASRILEQRLDLGRPLWEVWLIEGLAAGRWALICKVHHCLVDGVGGSGLMTLMFDLSPDQTPAELRPWTPEAEPSTLSLVLSGIRDTVGEPLRQAANIAALARRQAGAEITSFVGGWPRYAARLTQVGASSLNGPTSPHRRWLWAQADLDEVRRVRCAFGGTVNDVILAAVTGGFRDLLGARGLLSDDTLVRTVVPISVRAPGEQGLLTNRLSVVLVNLPCGEPDPVRRLDLVREQMEFLKDTHQAIGPDAFIRFVGMAPALLAAAARTVLMLRQPVVQAITTSIPGPTFPLYVMGRKLVAMYPYVPIVAGVRISIGTISYLGTLHFGLTGDFDAMPDLDVLSNGIRTGLDELVKEAIRT